MREFLTSIDPFLLFWIIMLVIFLVVEIMTVGLSAIWFAVGALVALVAASLQAPVPLQVVLFLVVSLGLLIATKPWVTKHINNRVQATNADRSIGREILLTEEVNNVKQTGKAVVDGQEWTVRAQRDEDVFAAGELVRVVKISGVKLIVDRKES